MCWRGSRLCKCFQVDDPAYGVCMVGLMQVGKTSILRKLQMGTPLKMFSAPEVYIEYMQYGHLHFTIWPIGRQNPHFEEQIQDSLRHCFRKARGLIFVVDSSDRENIDLAAVELALLLNEPTLSGVTLLVYANMQDKPGALTVAQVTELLGLQQIRGRRWHAQGASATTGDGLREGMDWIIDAMQRR